MPSSVNTMMHGVRGFFRFAHIDRLIPAAPAVYARLPKIHQDESSTPDLDRLELIRFLQVAQALTVHHGALAYLLGINALRASEAAAVRIEDYRETLRGHRVLQLIGKGAKPATMPRTVPVLRLLDACRGERTAGPLVLRPLSGKPIDRRDCYRMVARIAQAAGIPRHIMVTDNLWGSAPMFPFIEHSPFLVDRWGFAGTATESWAVPSGATPRHGARRERKPIESHTHITGVGSREESIPPDAWTESARTSILRGIV